MMGTHQGSEFVLFVTHVEADSVYLKIWGQVDKNAATCVERMILPLSEQFAKGHGCPGPQSRGLTPNALCCARFQDDGYYRAKICSVRPDGMVVLQFLDYGNVEVLPQHEIHLLESIPGSESLQSHPPLAYNFTLLNVLPVNGTWDNDTVETIKKTLWYNEYKVLLHSIVGPHRLVKLCFNNEDFSEFLIKEHMARPASIQDMFRPKHTLPQQVPQRPAYQQPSKEVITNNVAMHHIQAGGVNMLHCQANIPQPSWRVASSKPIEQPVPEALQFKSRVLDVGTVHFVLVSSVDDGPQKFNVQLDSTKEILTQLMTEINHHPTEPLREPPVPGSVCLGRYTVDGILCRAVVMGVADTKCKMYYVDFGHTESLPYKDIYQLPPHFINPKVLSIRFTLSGVKDLNLTEEMKAYFKEYVFKKRLVLHVRPPEGPPLIQYGDLYDDGKNIKDILRQAFPTPAVMPIKPMLTYQKPFQLTKGIEETVYISFVQSYQTFFVQLDKNIKPLESIMTCLVEYAKSAPPLNPSCATIGLPCAALYDNQWYRAQILDIVMDKAKVLYVDFGNEETVPILSLRVIHEDLVTRLPTQAIKCTWYDYQSLPCSKETTTQFEKLTLERRLHMKVIDVLPEGPLVDLYDPEKMISIKVQLCHTLAVDKNLSVESTGMKPITKNMHSENTEESNRKNHVDTWQPMHESAPREKSKTKSWKDEYNEDRQHDNKYEKSGFHREGTRYDRSNRDDFRGGKFGKDEPYAKREQNEVNSFHKGGRENRGGRQRFGSDRSNRGGGSDRSWSDKDSDSSSKGSGRRGRGSTAPRGGRDRRDGVSARLQNGRSNNRENDRGSYNKSARFNDDSRNNKFKERRMQNSTMPNMGNSAESWNMTTPYQAEPAKKSRISQPNISMGNTKQCELVFMNSPSDFFVQLNPEYLELDPVMERIASIYENGGDLMQGSEILADTYCIAQYTEDLKWYRAVIKSVMGNVATVEFVDYGNTEQISFDKIKSIQDEFLKLPMQAVRCKLLAVADCASNVFTEKVEGKTLEAEFVAVQNGLHEIVLRDVIDGTPNSISINEQLCGGIDLNRAKEEARSRGKPVENLRQSIQPDYVSPDSKWTVASYDPDTKKNVIVTWFTNPNNFYCQTCDKEAEFRSMMKDIQKMYAGREPVKHTLQVGSPVIAVFSEDGALYRAMVVEVNLWAGCKVQYIDFGNCAIVDESKMYPVERKLMQLPKLAIHCTLKDVAPTSGTSWSKANEKAIDECFNADNYECVFYNFENDKYTVSLNIKGKDVSDMLVERNLASRSSVEPVAVTNENSTTESSDEQKVDINLLCNQTLRVIVSSVQGATKFHVQLPSAARTENLVNSYMANKVPEVMPRLSMNNVCLGAGCLVHTCGSWRRAVVVNCSEPKGFDVKLIDTGTNYKIVDYALSLPSELSVMQNQALECGLHNVESRPELDRKLKELVEGKEVIIHVVEVDNDRLIVKVYDATSYKALDILEDSNEKIPPVCPMPILSSTHKVAVSFANSSSSVWFQRSVDYGLHTKVHEELNKHYAVSGKAVECAAGNLCAARSADGQWYRARIVTCTPTSAWVIYIDYGNGEELPFDALMELDPRFHQPYELAINASLTVTLRGSEMEQVNLLQAHLLGKELTAVFYNVHRKWIVELLENGEKLSEKFRSLGLVADQKASGSQQTQEQEAAAGGRKYNVCVSHADSPSQFWLQRVDETAALEEKQAALQADAAESAAIDGIPEEGSLCAAVYTIDSLWYRAEVLDADEGITTVRFIDYGNTDVIVDSGNIRQLSDDWKRLGRYATKCRLDVIPVDAEDWSEATCESFRSLVTTPELVQAVDVADGSPKRVELFIDDRSVSEMLVREHHAVMIRAEEEPVDEIVDLELDPRSAFVSHIDSPSEFWVQEEKSVPDLEVISDRFLVADMFPKIDKIEIGSLCVAKYPEDEMWYRARVTAHGEAGTEVIYIDYGNSAVSTEIREIPEDLAGMPPLSRKCCLPLPDGVEEWSEEACKMFAQLAADGATIFLLDVLKEQETSLVKLALDGKNVADMLADVSERRSTVVEERLPPLGEENAPNIVVSHVNSPDHFWVQAESSIAELEAMSERLQNAASFLPLDNFDRDTVCAALYPEDEQWYRAKILSHGVAGTEVLYVDYGNSAVTAELRVLPEDIANIPDLSKRCSLRLPENVACWSEEASKVFRELAAEGATMFQFEVLDEGEPARVRLSLNGQNVADILSAHCEKVSVASEDAARAEEGTATVGENESEDAAAQEASTEENRDENRQRPEVDDRSIEVIDLTESDEQVEVERDEDASDEARDTLAGGELETGESKTVDESAHDNSKEMAMSGEGEEADGKADEECAASSVKELTVDDIVGNMVMNAMADAEGQEGVSSGTIADTDENAVDVPPESDTVESATKGIESLEIELKLESASANSEGEDTNAEREHTRLIPNNTDIDKSDETTETDNNQNPAGDIENVKDSIDIECTAAPAAVREKEEPALNSHEDVEEPEETDEHSGAADGDQFPRTPKSQKIVPGSVSRGVSEMELVLNQVERRSTIAREDKIVPGSINKGRELQESCSRRSDCEDVSAERPDQPDSERTRCGTPTTPKIPHDDKVVAGSVSRGESPVTELQRPPTPKTPHSEKLVAGAVNSQEQIAEFHEEDETLTISVEDNIPKYVA